MIGIIGAMEEEVAELKKDMQIHPGQRLARWGRPGVFPFGHCGVAQAHLLRCPAAADSSGLTQGRVAVIKHKFCTPSCAERRFSNRIQIFT